MKKDFTIFIFGAILLFSGLNVFKTKEHKAKPVFRKNVILEHDIYDEIGVLFYKDLEDTITRVTIYEGKDYNYIEIGDTMVLKMSPKTFRKQYNKHNMMETDEMVIDPDSVLYKKNEILKDDSLTQIRRAGLERKLLRNPIQIVASKAERIQR